MREAARGRVGQEGFQKKRERKATYESGESDSVADALDEDTGGTEGGRGDVLREAGSAGVGWEGRRTKTNDAGGHVHQDTNEEVKAGTEGLAEENRLVEVGRAAHLGGDGKENGGTGEGDCGRRRSAENREGEKQKRLHTMFATALIAW